MSTNNSRTLLVKAAGLLGVASLSVLISLPGFSQQSPDNTNPNVPSTVKPTNPGGRDAGTTNGGENLNRVPSSNTNIQQNNSSGQPSSNPTSSDPASNPASVNRVEGREQGNQDRNNITPGGNPSQSGSYSQPGANQPGVTTGGDSSQQVERNQNNGSTIQQNSGSTMRQNRTMPQRSNQPSPQSQSDTNSGSTTDGTSTSQQQPSNGGVRALW